jgi:polyhydroxyalkanoate synthesis repressor PhaR
MKATSPRNSVVQSNKRKTSASPAAGPDGGKRAGRVIKKYPNRRLYDTETSSYITLTQVKSLVMKGLNFQVIDAKTGDDLTRSILLQIILEEETAGVPLFTEDALANIIRFYGQAMQGFMGTYLEKHVQSMIEMQTNLTEQSKGMTPEMWAQFMNMQSPMMQGVIGSYMEQSQKAFVQMQDQMQKSTEQMFGAFGIKR